MHKSVVMSKKQIWFQWSNLDFSAKMEKLKNPPKAYLDLYLQDFEKVSGMG